MRESLGYLQRFGCFCFCLSFCFSCCFLRQGVSMSHRRVHTSIFFAALTAAALLSVTGVVHADPPRAPAPSVPAASTAAPPASDAPPRCVPGAQTACACGGGVEGFQQCAEDGNRFGACVCAAPQPFRPPSMSAVPMSFLSYRGNDAYTVEVGGQRCETPCTLVLRPGPTSLHASGSGEVVSEFVVPHLPAQLRLAHDASTGYIRAGAVLVPTGIVVASSMWALGLACNGYDGGCYVANFTIWPILGVSMMTTGIVLLAVSGKHRAPDGANRPEIVDGSAMPAIRMTGIGLAPTATGAAGGLQLEF
jgi:hypothetical protein